MAAEEDHYDKLDTQKILPGTEFANCILHSKHKVCSVCEQCEELLCSECLDLHEDHPKTEVSEYLNNQQKLLKSRQTELKSSFLEKENQISKIEKSIKKCQRTSKIASKNLQDAADEMCHEIQKKKEELLDVIKKGQQTCVKGLSQHRERLEKHKQQFTAINQTIKQLHVYQTNPYELFGHLKTLRKHCTGALGLTPGETPSGYCPVFKRNEGLFNTLTTADIGEIEVDPEQTISSDEESESVVDLTSRDTILDESSGGSSVSGYASLRETGTNISGGSSSDYFETTDSSVDHEGENIYHECDDEHEERNTQKGLEFSALEKGISIGNDSKTEDVCEASYTFTDDDADDGQRLDKGGTETVQWYPSQPSSLLCLAETANIWSTVEDEIANFSDRRLLSRNDSTNSYDEGFTKKTIGQYPSLELNGPAVSVVQVSGEEDSKSGIIVYRSPVKFHSSIDDRMISISSNNEMGDYRSLLPLGDSESQSDQYMTLKSSKISAKEFQRFFSQTEVIQTENTILSGKQLKRIVLPFQISGFCTIQMNNKLLLAFVDRNEEVVIFLKNGLRYSRITDKLVHPFDVASNKLDPSHLYVTDNGTSHGDGSIKIYHCKGRYVRNFTGRLNKPMGIDVDNTGRVFVCDEQDHCIYKFTSDGQICQRFKFGTNSELLFHAPVYVTCSNDKDQLLISERRQGHVLIKYNLLSNEVTPLCSDLATEMSVPGMVCEDEDNVYIVCPHSNSLYVMTREGKVEKIILETDNESVRPDPLVPFINTNGSIHIY